jgi:hypothetical protein
LFQQLFVGSMDDRIDAKSLAFLLNANCATEEQSSAVAFGSLLLLYKVLRCFAVIH